jgi:hypothetical protein
MKTIRKSENNNCLVDLFILLYINTYMYRKPQ